MALGLRTSNKNIVYIINSYLVYAYCQSYYGVQEYSDRGVTARGLAVHVVYVYCQSYCGVQGKG